MTTSGTGSKAMAFLGGESTPDTVSLTGVDRVVETLHSDGTPGANSTRHDHGLTPDFRIWHIFREEQLWEPFARYFTYAVDSHKQLGVWMSQVEHRLEHNGG